jgi:hypothetical protein
MMEQSIDSAVTRLTRASQWTTVARIPLDFACFHPQGLERVGENFFMASVEIIEATVRYDDPTARPDRSAGRGRGHLFELTRRGELLRHWELGEDTMYHAGGLTYDGEDVWVPTSEYRPDSRSVMYTVNPRTGRVAEAFRYDDHLSGIARDLDTGLLHAITWGSRRILTLTPVGELRRELSVQSHYVDFQDCICAANGRMLWSGVAEYPYGEHGVFGLGGIAVLDMSTGHFHHEVPVTALSPAGRVVTYNATDLEIDGDRLRMYAVPDDGDRPGDSSLLVLETPL